MKKIIEVARSSQGCNNCFYSHEVWKETLFEGYLQYSCGANKEQQKNCFENDLYYEEVEE